MESSPVLRLRPGGWAARAPDIRRTSASAPRRRVFTMGPRFSFRGISTTADDRLIGPKRQPGRPAPLASETFLLLQGSSARDFFFNSRVEDEDVIDGQQDDDKPETGDIPLGERDDRVNHGGQQGRQVQEGEDRIEQ